jgi:hypothetical protein
MKNLTGRIRFQCVVVGDTLYKFEDGAQEPTLLGSVVEKTTNGKNKPVLVLDQVCYLGSDRLTKSAFDRLTIRRAER